MSSTSTSSGWSWADVTIMRVSSPSSSRVSNGSLDSVHVAARRATFGSTARTGGTRMRAAVVHDFTQPLRMEDRPTPRPGPGQVLVKVEASGLCHTDIHAAHGDWPVKPTLPFVPGHEGVGVVEAVRARASSAAEGGRGGGPGDARG